METKPTRTNDINYFHASVLFSIRYLLWHCLRLGRHVRFRGALPAITGSNSVEQDRIVNSDFVERIRLDIGYVHRDFFSSALEFIRLVIEKMINDANDVVSIKSMRSEEKL